MHILPRQDELSELVASGKESHAKADARQYATKAVAAVHRELEAHERAVKAMSAGYAPEDEAFYSVKMLKVLLPHYLDNGISAAPARGRELVPPASDPAESGNWIAMMIDVDHAFWRISKERRKMLTCISATPVAREADLILR